MTSSDVIAMILISDTIVVTRVRPTTQKSRVRTCIVEPQLMASSQQQPSAYISNFPDIQKYYSTIHYCIKSSVERY